jgi:choline dehydrogenase
MPVGKTLGGSTAINAMIYMRAHPSDFHAWSALAGDDWSPVQMSAVWDPMESQLGIHTLEPTPLHPAMQAFLAATDPNDSDDSEDQKGLMFEPHTGVARYLRCQNRGRRRSAYDLWLREPAIRERTRLGLLSIRLDAWVQRFVIDSESVTGVQVDCGGACEIIRANKGVICCAGAIHSPRLLIASGIGNATELGMVGIEPRVHLPAVGQNLQDHLIYPIVRELRQGKSIGPSPSRDQRLQYLRSRTGDRSSNIAELGGFFRFDSTDGAASPPDYQWHVTPTHYLEYPRRQDPTNALSVGVTLSRPASRGSLRLVRRADTHKLDSRETECAGSDYSEFELSIDPAYLRTQEDRDRMVDAVMETRERLSIASFEHLLGDELMPSKKR